MSKVYLCDYCREPAIVRVVAMRIRGDEIEQNDQGLDACEYHYHHAHPGLEGGGWWDDVAAPQSRGLPRDKAMPTRSPSKPHAA